MCRAAAAAPRRLPVPCQQLREAVWLAKGRHGFAALQGIPELQQLLVFAALPALQSVCCAATDCVQQLDAGVTHLAALDEEATLLPLLPPQLQLCLMAEVLTGLLCPS